VTEHHRDPGIELAGWSHSRIWHDGLSWGTAVFRAGAGIGRHPGRVCVAIEARNLAHADGNVTSRGVGAPVSGTDRVAAASTARSGGRQSVLAHGAPAQSVR
jgi:hypothetical protein